MRNDKNKKLKYLRMHKLNIGIKKQLVIGFVVPILFMVLIGIVSYQKSNKGLISNYEHSSCSSISMATKYLDYGFRLITSDLAQLTVDNELINYQNGLYSLRSNSMEESKFISKLRTDLLSKVAANELIHSISIIPRDYAKIIATKNIKGQGVFDKWEKTEEGKSFIQRPGTIHIVGTHSTMDELIESNTSAYALSFISIPNNKAACLVVDINRSSIINILNGLGLGEGSIAGFITSDHIQTIAFGNQSESVQDKGRSVNNTSLDISFPEQDFYKNCITSSSISGFEYVTYNNNPYLFIYEKSQVSNSIICALVPKSSVVKEANQIKVITSMLLFIACMIVLSIGAFICLTISRNMNKISKSIDTMAKGDLTIQINHKGNNEFSSLASNISKMIVNTRNLIEDVEQTANTVSKISTEVGHVSTELCNNSLHISNATSEIEVGTTQQAYDLQQCLLKMDILSQKIATINHDVSQIEQYIDYAKEMIRNGTNTIHDLADYAKTTNTITKQVTDSVKELEAKNIQIENFIDLINNISEQTNLLSLNASIEAARAGESGKGFSVVASSIRSLSDESKQAANEIQKIISEIKHQTSTTVLLSENAENIVNQQSIHVTETLDVFKNMNLCIENLLDNLKQIGITAQDVNNERIMTLQAVESISSVSEETAASSSVVSKITSDQLITVEMLQQASNELNINMQRLETTLSIFKIR